MPLYHFEYTTVGSPLPLSAGPCVLHADCLECPELAAACGDATRAAADAAFEAELPAKNAGYHDPAACMARDREYHANEKRRHATPVWSCRFVVTERDFNAPREPGSNDYPMVERHVQATCYATYVGQVVELGVDYNVRVMSDVRDDVGFAMVIDGGRIEKVGVDGADCYGQHLPSVYEGRPANVVDSAPEARDALALLRMTERQVNEHKSALYQQAAHAKREEEERKAPRKGRRCRVVRGRKIPIGIEGVCFWMGDSRYGTRVGLKVDGKTDPVWVDARHVEAVTS